ncbi:uncharacterized protein [Aegilops tauschii subsp. strangulata]|uniref:uncharacterized protein n=1 Tax=Aegilops tauschii subsp. strangulata TaxID=200361 RepID=UPI00098B1C03
MLLSSIALQSNTISSPVLRLAVKQITIKEKEVDTSMESDIVPVTANRSKHAKKQTILRTGYHSGINKEVAVVEDIFSVMSGCNGGGQKKEVGWSLSFLRMVSLCCQIGGSSGELVARGHLLPMNRQLCRL